MYPLNNFFKQYFSRYAIPSIQHLDTCSPQDHSLAYFSKLLNDAHTNHLGVVQILSDELAIPWLNLEEFNTSTIPIHVLSEFLLRQYAVLPLFERGKGLYLALANPFQAVMLEAIAFYTQKSIHMILVEQPKLETARKKLLRHPALPLNTLSKETTTTSQNGQNAQGISQDDMQDPPLVRYVNKLLTQAIDQKASDIHFEPHQYQLQLRFRIDGILYPRPSPPSTLSNRIFSRIKIMAKLDVTEKRFPQNGRFRFVPPDGNHAVDCRISTCPTFLGEKIVIRLLNLQKDTLNIEHLGFNVTQHQLFLNALCKTQGMILVTGPTGSGKTMTLYSGLNYLNQNTVNIATIEDPIEIYLPGINQANIQPKIGLDFPDLLKAFLRQDPDIIMLGEIRDTKTAQVSIQAAQTGHLVLSTLHTNSASETLTRLLNMGIPAYNIFSSIQLIIAQRLARRLCIHCKEKVTLSSNTLLKQNIFTPVAIKAYKKVGCQQCTQGYHGRIGIFELLPVTSHLAACLSEQYISSAIQKKAVSNGMLTLQDSAFEKLKAGVIDLEEMKRISQNTVI